MTLIDDIKDRLHIEDVVSDVVKLEQSRTNWKGLCPFHQEKTPSFFVFPDSQRYKCFGCGAGGDVIDFAMEYHGWEMNTALRELAREANVQMRPLSADEKRTIQRRREKEAVFAVAAEFFFGQMGMSRGDQKDTGSPGLDYARGRGFDDTTIRNHGLGYFGKDWDGLRKALDDGSISLGCPAAVALIGYRGDVRAWGQQWDVDVKPAWVEAGKVPAMPPDMLIYPHVLKGRVTYLAGRRLSDEGPKSWNPPSKLVGPRQPFFNSLWGKTRPEKDEEDGTVPDSYPFSAIVEGQACAISCAQWGIPAGALAGCDLSGRADPDHPMLSQLSQQLKRTGGRAVIGLDDDRAGRTGAETFADHLMRGLELKATDFHCVTWPGGDDANAWLQAGATQTDAWAEIGGAHSWLDVLVEAARPEDEDDEGDQAAVRAVFSALAGLDVYDVARQRDKIADALMIKKSTFDALLKAARREEGLGDDGKPAYLVVGGRLTHRYYDGRGMEIFDPLANFSAEIEAEVVEDDGDTQERTFRIKGKLADSTVLPSVEVPAGDFSKMGWVLGMWGARAVVEAGASTRDHLRAAIQSVSRDVESRFVYAHLGWREINDSMAYLSGSGAVGRDGVEVNLPTDLMRYQLPQHPEDVEDALEKSFRFIEVGDYAVTIPLLSAMYLAPLSTIIPPSFTLWVYGTTGSLKSTATALALCHYGTFSYNTPPASWTGTANALERKTFIVKDAPLWIDDYTTQSTFSGMNELKAKVDRLLRDWGNRSGRSRMQANLKLRQTFAPRGMIISTAEQLPPGQSIQARLFQIQVHPDMMTRGAGAPLTIAQTEEAQSYPHAMGGYVMWLSEQWEDLEQQLPQLLLDYTESARSRGAHLRMPGNVATLFIGWKMYLDYCQHMGVDLGAAYDDLRELGWDVLVALGDAQQIAADEEKPVEMYMSAISQMIAQGSIFLRHRDYCELPEKNLPSPEQIANNSEFLGWYDEEYVYLIPSVSFKAVCQFYRGSGVVFPDTERGLKVKMKEENYLFPAERPSKPTYLYQVSVPGRPWVWRIVNFLNDHDEGLPQDL